MLLRLAVEVPSGVLLRLAVEVPSGVLLRLVVEVPSSVVICVKTGGEFPVVCVKPEVRSYMLRVLGCTPEKALS